MDDREESREPEDLQINVSEGIRVREKIDVWLRSNFAHDWYMDAWRESQLKQGGEEPRRNSMRREILFAVCAAESYLLEWVRDSVLSESEIEAQFELYFPTDAQRGAKQKWKAVTEKLLEKEKISNTPDWESQEWTMFTTLVDYRDGLVHAKASLPKTDGRLEPSFNELDRKKPGWAFKIVDALIRHLHERTKTDRPAWLIEP